MEQYKVSTGENIYDVAMTLYGSVEGVFDLLISNDWLTMETSLKKDDILNYHTEFVVNVDVAKWLSDNGVQVKNGEHIASVALTNESIIDIVKHYRDGELYDDEEEYLASITEKRLVVRQNGIVTIIGVEVSEGLLIVDYGDISEPVVMSSAEGAKSLEHCYEDAGEHIISFYGNFKLKSLDLTDLNGIYYALSPINISESFASRFDTSDAINQLFIIKEQNEQVDQSDI